MSRVISNFISFAILAGGASTRMGEDKGLVMLNGKHMIEHIMHSINDFLSILNLNSVIKTKIILHDYIQQEEYLNAIPELSEEDIILDEVVWNKTFSDIPKPPQNSIFGLWTALTELKSEAQNVFILPCDAPLISEAVISYIFNEFFKNSINNKSKEFSMKKFKKRFIGGQIKSESIDFGPKDSSYQKTYISYIPKWANNKLEPLFAIYHIKSILPIVEQEIFRKHYSLQHIFDEIMNPDSPIYQNINYRIKLRTISIEDEISKYDPKLHNFIDVNSMENLRMIEEIFHDGQFVEDG